MNEYVYSLEDAVALVLACLDDQIGDQLVEDDYDVLYEGIQHFGKSFVLIDQMHTVTLNMREACFTKTLYIISFVIPSQHLLIYLDDLLGTYTEIVNSNEVVLEKLHAFINKATSLTIDEIDAINMIVEAYRV